MGLPTREEYLKQLEISEWGRWSDPLYICPSCGEGGMRMDRTIVLTSFPPKYYYECNKCGYVEVW